MSSSRLADLFIHYQQALHRIDALEQRLEETVAAKRLRAANLLDITPTHRSSHLRVFVTHHVEDAVVGTETNHDNLKRKWTLVIEGKLLVGYLDHEQAAIMDREPASPSHNNLPVTTTSAAASTAAGGIGTISMGLSTLNAPTQVEIAPAMLTTSTMDRSGPNVSNIAAMASSRSNRDGPRGYSDNDTEEPPPMIQFTHFFDRISVSFQSFQQVNKSGGKGDKLQSDFEYSALNNEHSHLCSDDLETTHELSATSDQLPGRVKRLIKPSSSVDIAKKSSNVTTPTSIMPSQGIEGDKDRIYISSNHVTTLKWDRQQQTKTTGSFVSIDDSQAFQILYEDEADTKLNDPQVGDSVVVATIYLYRRWGAVERYKPSRELCAALFPSFLSRYDKKPGLKIKKKEHGTKRTHAQVSGPGNKETMSTPKKKIKKKISGNMKMETSKSVPPLNKTFPRVPDKISFTRSDASDIGLTGFNLSSTSTVGGILESTMSHAPTASDNTRLHAESGPLYDSPPSDNDIYIPHLLTMEEVIGAIFRYIKDGELLDKNDPSIVINDAALASAFGCKVMNFSAIKGLLHSRGLIRKVTSIEHPIILTYIMKRDTDMPKVNNLLIDSLGPKADAPLPPSIVPVATASTAESDKTAASEVSMTLPCIDSNNITTPAEAQMKVHVGHCPNFLTFDVDVDVPTLFPFRTREILSRIKRREFDWTNARTKALRMVQATKVEEDIIKDRLEDIVKGRGLTKDHLPVLLALAKTSSAGSQARTSAHIDARMTLLMERLDYHSNVAAACCDVVNTCILQS